MRTLWIVTGWNFGAVVAMMIIGWLISVRYRNVTIVDSLWGLGFVLIAWITFFHSEGFPGRKLLIAALVTVWGIRLSIYLSSRNWGAGEDPRYGEWRKNSGEGFWMVSLFKVFLLQAIFLWTTSLVLQVGQIAPRPGQFIWLDVLGALVWVIGFFFESVGGMKVRIDGGTFVNYAQFESGIVLPQYVASQVDLNSRAYVARDSMICNFA